MRHQDIATLSCLIYGTKLTTVHNGDERHQQALKAGMQCPTCKSVRAVSTFVLHERHR